MALDEATAGLLAGMAESGAKPLHEMTPAEARGFGEMLRELYGPGPAVAAVREERVPVAGGDTIAVRVLNTGLGALRANTELTAAVDAVTRIYGKRFTMQDLDRTSRPTTSGLRTQPSMRFRG